MLCCLEYSSFIYILKIIVLTSFFLMHEILYPHNKTKIKKQPFLREGWARCRKYWGGKAIIKNGKITFTFTLMSLVRIPAQAWEASGQRFSLSWKLNWLLFCDVQLATSIGPAFLRDCVRTQPALMVPWEWQLCSSGTDRLVIFLEQELMELDQENTGPWKASRA